jgi:hypothetical protein
LNFDEDVRDFGLAWRLQADRKKGINLPKACRTPAWLQYSEVGKLGEQVERMISVFPRNQVKFIIFDDFTSDTQAVYADVLSFLGVPHDGRKDFPRINENKYYLFPWLSRFYYRPPRVILYPVRRIKKLMGLDTIRFFPKLLRLTNEQEKPRPPLEPKVRVELVHEFREDILKLSALLNRDLTHWYV